MSTKGKRLAAVLGLSTVVLTTGVGVYAAKNDASLTGAFDKSRPQMMQQFGSGEMMKPPRMEQFGSGEMMKPPRMEQFGSGEMIKPPRMEQFGSGEMIKPPRMDGFNSEEGMRKGEKENRFGFAFIDEKNLTDTQKEEIEKLQEERDEAIKKINDEFFDKLEKFISEEKLEDYENFVANHENMKGMKQGKGNHKIRGIKPTKDIQKPKTTSDEE